ncbi:MAG: alpha-1,6-glucosidase domain-containing protein [Burkholderiaceae bacterium]
MKTSWMAAMRAARHAAAAVVAALAMTACGGGGSAAMQSPAAAAVTDDASPAAANSTSAQTLLHGLPAATAQAVEADAATTTLRIHYHRPAGDYAGWQLHTWNAAVSPTWNAGWAPSGTDAFGDYWDVQLASGTGTVGYLFHDGDTKDDGGADQSYVLQPGANEIWRVQGDLATYTSNPLTAPPPDITTLRVHYLRFAGDYDRWGLHLWDGSGLDTSRLPGVNIGDWNHPVPFAAIPGEHAGTGEIVFDLPVLDPATRPGSTSLEFIIHGLPPNDVNDKDGRPANIHVDFASLKIVDQVGEIWLVQQDPTVYTAVPDLRSVSTTDARAVWLNSTLLQWPRVFAGNPVKLYWSMNGQIQATLGQKITGADGSIALDPYTDAVPTAAATRFKWVGAGGVFAVRASDVAKLKRLHTAQLLAVQEDATGAVQNATATQIAGAMDELYAAAQTATMGTTITHGTTTVRVWAPTAQAVTLYLYKTATGASTIATPLNLDPATGIWSLAIPGDFHGYYYAFGVRVFVRGLGIVRNVVTDPYSVSLAANSTRSEFVDLDDPRSKPAGWDASQPPATVAGSTDMSIYELHVRDFSDNDPTVPAAHRGKYLAFTDASSNGMKHLRALAQAGLTDVHLMPAFDFSSVPETGCTTPSPAGAPDSSSQQAAVAATASTDCYNWGYDPWHFGAPEGSYATSVADGVTRVIEFRRMVQSLNAAGLRVGLDMVFNHTAASGEDAHSVLDQIVPGYYHRLDATGAVTRDSCCDDTATENAMMGKLMTDTVAQWAREYHVSSFRFDIMGIQPRAAMMDVQAKVDAAVGHHVEMLGEGWNFGVVANDARFVQADMFDMNGTGIGTFNPYVRDAVRGGGCCDSGNALVANQGYVNGLWYDPNAQGGGHAAGDLMWLGDVIKASLAGSVRGYALETSWDATLPIEQIAFEGTPLGYVSQPTEVVNYVENHDNLTLFDNDAYKLPTATSREDRARVQMLGAAIDAFSQGVAYFHAGVDTLRSKSLDANSYDSGDWFNRLDWSYQADNFGVGLPPAASNQANWALAQPLLANAAIKPTATEIAWTRNVFRDLLRIRASTTLLRLRTADDIKARLKFYNTGSHQIPTLLVGDVDGRGYPGANFDELAYFINVDKQPHAITIPALQGRRFRLHPAQAAANATDKRAAAATVDDASGTFVIPARTAAVFVVPQ